MFRRLAAACCGLLWSAAVFAAGSQPVTLRVMTFNVEYGGTVVAFDKVIEAIRVAGPDVVGLEEPAGNTREIARRLGWPYASTRTDVISRFPIIDPPGGDGRYVFVEIRPGAAIAVGNVHLPSDPYGPYLVRDGEPLARVLALENTLRLPEIEPFLAALAPLPAAGMAAVLMGDFNSPSHQDWIAATTGLRPHMRYPVPWPVTVAVTEAGFVDSYRAVHPDPAAAPGLTWWAPRPSTEDVYTEQDPRDRIDLVFAAGPARALDSVIVGEAGADGAAFTVTPWPSDHRAVMSTFEVTPALLPDMVAVNDQRLLDVGDTLTVHYRRRSAGAGAVVLMNADGEAVLRAGLEHTSTSGNVVLDTCGLVPGRYQAALRTGSGTIGPRVPLWLKAASATTTVALDSSAYRPGEPITLRWRNSPGNRWDWIAIYATPAGTAPVPVRNGQRIWRYTGSAIEGEFVIDANLQDGGNWPLPPGHYTLFYMVHDDYEPLASATFEIIE